jgi:hypothetical protein
MNNEQNNINDYFKIPIFYNKNKMELNENIITDLELIKTIDPSSTPIYSYYLNNNNILSNKLTEQITKYYTDDIQFLKEYQILLKEYKTQEEKYILNSPNYKNIIEIWDELKLESGFKEKYYYVDWEILEFLNKSEIFLQFMSIYNLFSPILSLLVPIIILIIPFFIIRLKGLNLTINDYINVLKVVAQTNAIGKLFTTNFNDINVQEKLYIFISAAFYIFSIYQNIMVCVRFNKNMQIIHNHFSEFRTYLKLTIQSMKNYLSYSAKFNSQFDFNNVLGEKLIILENIYDKLIYVSDYNLYNIKKAREIGYILKYFYELHTNKIYEDAIMYSFGFNGYIDCIEGLIDNLNNKKINFSIFSDKNKNKKKTIFKNNYYACLKNNNPVKNTIKLHKNIIITGPNASGKTTILKSLLLNVIFTQQFGCGFYDSAKLTPFKNIHCYLNIPDTSGRDSLFQAEARRCKEILDNISINKDETHFCVFDELYSGTNPEEAEITATAFIQYLIKNKNITCLLTTHFINVCNNLKNNKNILNCCMLTTKTMNYKLLYTYKLKKGISNIKGGISVLTEMNYPKEIIENTQKYRL